MGDLLFGNALWWGHSRLQGGSGKIGIRTGVYVAFIAAAFLLFCRIPLGLPIAAIAGRAIYFVGVAQLAMALVMCSSRLNKAVFEDKNSGMSESHRLSPMTGINAVTGYMIGPNIQVLCLAAANFCAGLFFSALSGKWLLAWVAAHLYLGFVAIFVWSAVVLAAVTIGRKTNLMVVLIVIAVLGGWRILPVIPALGLLFGSEMIRYCYDVMTGGGARGVPAGAGLTVVVQILLILSCVRAAACKFDRPDLPAFSEFRATLMYAGWVAVAIIGLGRAGELELPFIDNVSSTVHLVGTLILSALFLILPIRSSAIVTERWHLQHRELRGRRPIGPAVMAIGMSLLSSVLIVGVSRWAEWTAALKSDDAVPGSIFSQWTWTAVCMALTGLSLAVLYGATCALRFKSIDLLPVGFLFLTWAVFPMLDAFREAYREMSIAAHVSSVSFLTASSPAGGIVVIWGMWKSEYWIALGVQGLCCAAAIGVYALAMRRSRKRLLESRTDR